MKSIHSLKFPHLLAALLFALSGCGGAETPEIDTSPSESAGDEIAAVVDAPQRREVTMIHEGSGDAVLLQYAPEEGSSYQMRVESMTRMAITVGGQAAPTPPIPNTSSIVEHTISEVTSETFKVSWTILSFDVDGQGDVADQMRGMLAPLVGASGWVQFSMRGEGISENTDIPDDAHPMLRSMLENMQKAVLNAYPPLPEQPVAPGAQWRHTAPIQSPEISFVQSTTVTLQSATEDEWTLAMNIEQQAEPQRLGSQDPNVRVELQQMTGGGRGEVTVRRNAMVRRSSSDVQTRMDSIVYRGQDSAPMVFEMQIQSNTSEVAP